MWMLARLSDIPDNQCNLQVYAEVGHSIEHLYLHAVGPPWSPLGGCDCVGPVASPHGAKLGRRQRQSPRCCPEKHRSGSSHYPAPRQVCIDHLYPQSAVATRMLSLSQRIQMHRSPAILSRCSASVMAHLCTWLSESCWPVSSFNLHL